MSHPHWSTLMGFVFYRTRWGIIAEMVSLGYFSELRVLKLWENRGILICILPSICRIISYTLLLTRKQIWTAIWPSICSWEFSINQLRYLRLQGRNFLEYHGEHCELHRIRSLSFPKFLYSVFLYNKRHFKWESWRFMLLDILLVLRSLALEIDLSRIALELLSHSDERYQNRLVLSAIFYKTELNDNFLTWRNTATCRMRVICFCRCFFNLWMQLGQG